MSRILNKVTNKMAHLIKLYVADVEHNSTIKYKPALFNLDTVVQIEPDVSDGNHSIILTRWSNEGIKVKESLDEILELSNNDPKLLLG